MGSDHPQGTARIREIGLMSKDLTAWHLVRLIVIFLFAWLSLACSSTSPSQELTATPPPTETPVYTSDLSAPEASPTPTGDPRFIWQADHEAGNLSQWYLKQDGAIYNTGICAMFATHTVSHSGEYAVELSIYDANGNTQACRIFRTYENLEAGYYSAWFYFPRRYQVTEWWNIFQFKSKTDTLNDPMWILNVGNRPDGEMFLYFYDWKNRQGYPALEDLNIPVKQWFQIEVFYRRSTDHDGEITMWQDGVLLYDIKGVRTAIAGNIQWSINNYTDNVSPYQVTFYMDDAAITTIRLSGE